MLPRKDVPENIINNQSGAVNGQVSRLAGRAFTCELEKFPYLAGSHSILHHHDGISIYGVKEGLDDGCEVHMAFPCSYVIDSDNWTGTGRMVASAWPGRVQTVHAWFEAPTGHRTSRLSRIPLRVHSPPPFYYWRAVFVLAFAKR